LDNFEKRIKSFLHNWMKKLAISVIIVVLNGEKYLKSAIDSVINQSHQPDEIIVVDGNSTDETAVIAKSFMQVTYIKQSGTGLANARNNGIDFATGDLIAFLDSDDLWTENKLKIQLEHFTNDPEIEYSYGRLKLFIKPGGTEPRTGYTQSSFLEPIHGRTPGTLIVRKSLFKNIGKFRTEYKIGCDFEWFTRVKNLKVPFAFVPETILLKRVHNSNLSNDVETNRNEILKIVRQSLHYQRQ
jgi:glycosyltransferase involved in cell wall biosynthesis